jgi:hypothetical protein
MPEHDVGGRGEEALGIVGKHAKQVPINFGRVVVLTCLEVIGSGVLPRAFVILDSVRKIAVNKVERWPLVLEGEVEKVILADEFGAEGCGGFFWLFGPRGLRRRRLAMFYGGRAAQSEGLLAPASHPL